jgi:hypothetical protein
MAYYSGNFVFWVMVISLFVGMLLGAVMKSSGYLDSEDYDPPV